MADWTSTLLGMQKQIREKQDFLQKERLGKSDRELATDRINADEGTAADSVFVGLKPRATTQTTPEHTEWERNYARLKDIMTGNPDSAKVVNSALMKRVGVPMEENAPKTFMERMIEDVAAASPDSATTANRAKRIATGLEPRATAKTKPQIVQLLEARDALPEENPKREELQRSIDLLQKRVMPEVSYEKALQGKETALDAILELKEGSSLPDNVMALMPMIQDKSTQDWIAGMMNKPVDEATRKQLIGVLNEQVKYYDSVIVPEQKKMQEASLQKAIDAFTKNYPPIKYDGRTATDPETGKRFISENGTWREIVPEEK